MCKATDRVTSSGAQMAVCHYLFFANASSKFDTFLQGNLQVEILIKSLEMGQERYNSLVFATGPCSWNLTCAVSLLVSFKTVAKFRRLISLPKTIQYFLPVAATSLGAGFQVYLSKLWVLDVTKAVRYDLLIYCLLSDIFLYFLLVAATSLIPWINTGCFPPSSPTARYAEHFEK